MCKTDRYDPNYPYEKNTIDTGISEKGYPIIERTSNGLIFPEGPQNNVDMNDIKPFD
ncbi:hypothetical protein HBE96_18045 [Clostridium sp. P21]|uniref:Uncharacterized protein n=1 Tax=Clostridium muellerianum TaxID=2716538 RepID=A0A7Y0HQU4_9CLOT|nr:hypothetical protein [Clostridium muellerianum]NMM64516.1 hypothetical protein [Clostridium muellerianum]